MSNLDKAGTFRLGDRTVKRIGYGAMQLAGPHVFGPPRDPDAARAVLREAIALGVDHIDTSDYYGPHVTNQLIRDALAPYPRDLTIVSKIGARRGDDASWLVADSPAELRRQVEGNLTRLGIEALDVVNLRFMFAMGPAEGDIEPALTAVADALRERTEEIVAANAKDVAQARENGISEAMIDRLTLTPARITAIADAVHEIVELPDHLRRSLTWDQGKEMAAHARFSVATDVPVYFCDPRSPWQRGSNENTNGLLRQYFPKRSEIAHYTQADLDKVAAELNDRPRQTLGWRSPSQALDDALR